MAIGGIAELFFGVSAEQQAARGDRQPLTAQDAGEEQDDRPEPQSPAPRPAGRFRPGPGRSSTSPGMWPAVPVADSPMDREIEAIERALVGGPETRQELARDVGARYWGPGRFHGALGQAVAQGRVRRVGRRFAAR